MLIWTYLEILPAGEMVINAHRCAAGVMLGGILLKRSLRVLTVVQGLPPERFSLETVYRMRHVEHLFRERIGWNTRDAPPIVGRSTSGNE